MQRRDSIGFIGATVLAIPRLGYAQTKTDMPLVGFLVGVRSDSSLAKNEIAELQKGLQEEGFFEGKNYSLAVRFAEGDMLGRYPKFARELATLNDSVIIFVGAVYGIREFRQSFPELPVVFTAIAADFVALGLVQSYVHPGGMLTGNVMNAVGGEETITQKRISLFKELIPNLKRLGVIAPAKGVLAKEEKAALQKVAARLSFEVSRYDLNTIDDLESAFAAGLRDDVSAFFISGEPLLTTNVSRVMSFVTASGKPSVGPYPVWGRAGVLMSYATDVLDGLRHAGIYAGKILHGAKPGDLPIEQASKFTLCHQSQDGESARHRSACVFAGARRRGDRVTLAIGLKANCCDRSLVSAQWSIPNQVCSR
jgi:putative ABC transport system substrate-binding protein